MSNLLSISLNNVRFRAYHGLYPEERQKGNDFVVNLRADYEAPKKLIVSLDETIDYAIIFEIINRTMQKPVDLLETLVQTLCAEVHQAYPNVKAIEVSVEKLNPPIDKFSGTATVSYSTTF